MTCFNCRPLRCGALSRLLKVFVWENNLYVEDERANKTRVFTFSLLESHGRNYSYRKDIKFDRENYKMLLNKSQRSRVSHDKFGLWLTLNLGLKSFSLYVSINFSNTYLVKQILLLTTVHNYLGRIYFSTKYLRRILVWHWI